MNLQETFTVQAINKHDFFVLMGTNFTIQKALRFAYRFAECAEVPVQVISTTTNKLFITIKPLTHDTTKMGILQND